MIATRRCPQNKGAGIGVIRTMAVILRWALVVLGVSCSAFEAMAQDAGLARQLANPVASLISVPLQANYDSGYGPRDGEQVSLRLQPVVPFPVNDEWKVISRTILPFVWQQDIGLRKSEQIGLGDAQQSFFFSPKHPSSSGILWGAGPIFLLPTGSDELLSAEKWGAGPTAVALRQQGPWTVGLLANHLWSFGGEDRRRDIDLTLLQPFVAYTTKKAWTFAVNTESSYDWVGNTWIVPVNAIASKLVRFGQQPVSLGVGLRYWANSPDNGPEGFGIRFIVTFLFPR
jgi:hypothetical protein